MDADILELVKQERLAEAAALASARGDPAEACALFERACDWKSAAREALRANDPRKALDLALQAHDTALAEEALARAVRDRRAVDVLGPRLLARGYAAWAARAYEAAGRGAEAASAWEQAGDAVRASLAYEKRGEAPRAVRVLEAALRRRPEPALFLALGNLLLRLGKDEAAVRALQRVPRDAAERAAAEEGLAPALARLGLANTRPVATAAQAAVEAPRLLLGRYRWIADMASSPAARVFEAEAPVSGERVVLKVFALSTRGAAAASAVARFERDVRTVMRAPHPHLVPVRDVLPEVPATVLAKMPAGSLEELLARGPLAPARAAEIACSVLSALAEAHRRGVLHRAVKPSNVLFDAAGSARLGDFGTVHLSDVSATATAGAFGSQGYRSPEEREGRPASTRSDVFSVGIVLHEMLTGTRPSSAPLPASAPGVPPSTAHPDLRGAHDRLLARMTATDPESRPPDAFAARTEIEGLAWPSRLRPRSEGERAEAAYDGAAPPRLQVRRDGTEFDTWTGRAIERVPLSDDLLVRARAFAAVSHAGLQPVLRVDREGATLGGTLWMLHLPARDPWLRLSPREHAGLADAVRALHAHGIVHGAVNAAHLAFAETSARDREAIGDDDRPPIVLRFSPPPPPGATFADDLADLARLA